MNLEQWAQMTPANRDTWLNQQTDVTYLQRVINYLHDAVVPMFDILEQLGPKEYAEITCDGITRELTENAMHLITLRIQALQPARNDI